jgi:NADH-quinone oxidoreductase subunit L
MWLLTHVWIIPALPTLGFVVTLLFGKRVLGEARAHWIGLPLIAIAFALSLATAGAWISHTSHDEPITSEAAGFDHVDPNCSTVSAGVRAGTFHVGDEGSEASADSGAAHEAAASESAPAEQESVSQPVVSCRNWWTNGSHQFHIGTIADGQSVLMLVVVTLVSLLVHLYSSDYVKGDRRYTHYYAFLSLFTASMLFFVLGENVLQMIVGWELVGLCSYALIGHWWEEQPNADAAMKAFLTNRVGDIGLMIGMIILFFGAGQTFDVIDINTKANTGGMSHGVLLAASLCLIAAVMSKSGQFILHTWLPDAMAGPTPVSALIHAATMVVAGIYMVARLYPVFFHGLSIAGSGVNLLAVVGAVTALLGALLAFVQKDIKKVLAYSTISQLGFMVTALGVGAWTAALFHLFTHAMFKACLFLGAGSLSHASHHSFDMVDDMGGLRKKMPVTFWTYVLATGALAGIFPLAGFWSKDEILAGTGGANTAVGTYYFALVVLIIAAAGTAAYMTRTIWYAFYNGKYKGHGEPHESGPRMAIPLIVLGGMSVIAGFANLPQKIFFDWHLPSWLTQHFEHLVEPVGAFFPGHAGGFTHAEFNGWLAFGALALAVGAIVFVYLYYWKGLFRPLHGLAERNAVARTGKLILENKYYLDWLYTDVIVAFVKGPLARAAYWVNQHVIDGVVNGAGESAVKAGSFVYQRIDQGLVDGTVNGTALIANETGEGLSKSQTGRVQQYAALLFAAAAILAGVFVLVVG